MISSLTAPCRQLYRCVFRVVGRNMVQQRTAMEAGWRKYVEEVLFVTQRQHTSSMQQRARVYDLSAELACECPHAPVDRHV